MSAVILAGGKSSRMGYDKADILIDGRSILKKTIELLKCYFNEIIICGRKGKNENGIRYVDDCLKERGPIGGLYTGLYYSSEAMNFVTACDIPDVDMKIVEYMECRACGHDGVVIYHNGYFEPLFGFYNKNVMSVLKKNILEGNLKITNMYRFTDMVYITYEDIRAIRPFFNGIYNINTPFDLEKYKNKAKGNP